MPKKLFSYLNKLSISGMFLGIMAVLAEKTAFNLIAKANIFLLVFFLLFIILNHRLLIKNIWSMVIIFFVIAGILASGIFLLYSFVLFLNFYLPRENIGKYLCSLAVLLLAACPFMLISERIELGKKLAEWSYLLFCLGMVELFVVFLTNNKHENK